VTRDPASQLATLRAHRLVERALQDLKDAPVPSELDSLRQSLVVGAARLRDDLSLRTRSA
jgi:hypothetical protein